MNKDDIEIEKGLNLIAKSSIFVFFAIFLSKLFTYLYRIIIARYYGPEVYGLFSLGVMIFGFFVAFASLGFSEGIVRFIPRYRANNEKEKIKYLVKFSNKILLFSGIFSAILLFFSAEFISIKFFHNNDLIFYLKLFSFLIPIHLFMSLYFSVLRSHERINANSFGMNILQNFVKLIFIGFFIFLSLSVLKAVPFSYFLGTFAGLIFAYIYCKIKLSYVLLKPILSKDKKLILRKKFFSYSWPLIFMALMSFLLLWIDTFFIGFFEDVYSVGIYNAAIPIATLLLFSSEIFMQMFFPMITRELSSKNFVVVRELSKQITKWILIINIPLTILILFFPGVFINFFFGEEYLLANNVLRFLTLGYFVHIFSSVPTNLLLAKGKSKIILVNMILVSILNFILNFILIPLYSLNGAAFATGISLSIFSLLAIGENYYINKIFPFRRKMVPIFLIAFALSGILYFISHVIVVNMVMLILIGFSFIFIYLLLILITDSFDKNDLGVIKKFFNKL